LDWVSLDLGQQRSARKTKRGGRSEDQPPRDV
jgi:hypothetical protein